ncbi:MAG: DUF3515 family protein [Mycobacteriales bacterium]
MAMTAGAMIACSRGESAVKVAVPEPGNAVRRACEQLATQLPDSLGGELSRRRTDPASPLIAAWGSPAVVLRCGVPIDPAYTTGDQVIEVGASGATVRWYAAERDHRAVWSTPLATVHVELSVPGKYQGAELLARLTPSVSGARLF